MRLCRAASDVKTYNSGRFKVDNLKQWNGQQLPVAQHCNLVGMFFVNIYNTQVYRGARVEI